MSDDFLKVKKGLNTKPQTVSVTNPSDGDVYYESARATHTVQSSGFAMDLTSSVPLASAANLTSANFTVALLRSPVIVLTGTTASAIHGLSAVQSGRKITVVNGTNQAMTILNESVTEGTATNRILTAGALTIPLAVGGSIDFVRDAVNSRWRAAFPQAPVTAKDAGVFSWNVNNLRNNTNISNSFDGYRLIPANKAITIYGTSVSLDHLGFSGGTVTINVQYLLGSTWTNLNSTPYGILAPSFWQTNSTITNIAADASVVAGSGPGGIVFRMLITGLPTTLLADLSVNIYWREQ